MLVEVIDRDQGIERCDAVHPVYVTRMERILPSRRGLASCGRVHLAVIAGSRGLVGERRSGILARFVQWRSCRGERIFLVSAGRVAGLVGQRGVRRFIRAFYRRCGDFNRLAWIHRDEGRRGFQDADRLVLEDQVLARILPHRHKADAAGPDRDRRILRRLLGAEVEQGKSFGALEANHLPRSQGGKRHAVQQVNTAGLVIEPTAPEQGKLRGDNGRARRGGVKQRVDLFQDLRIPLDAQPQAFQALWLRSQIFGRDLDEERLAGLNAVIRDEFARRASAVGVEIDREGILSQQPPVFELLNAQLGYVPSLGSLNSDIPSPPSIGVAPKASSFSPSGPGGGTVAFAGCSVNSVLRLPASALQTGRSAESAHGAAVGWQRCQRR